MVTYKNNTFSTFSVSTMIQIFFINFSEQYNISNYMSNTNSQLFPQQFLGNKLEIIRVILKKKTIRKLCIKVVKLLKYDM